MTGEASRWSGAPAERVTLEPVRTLRNRYVWIDAVVAAAAAGALTLIAPLVVAVAGLLLAVVGIGLTQAFDRSPVAVRTLLISLGFMLPALAYYGYHLATAHW